MVLILTKEELPLRLIYLSLLTTLYSQDTLDVDLDLDRLWEEAVWEEIEDVVDVYYEVEQITLSQVFEEQKLKMRR